MWFERWLVFGARIFACVSPFSWQLVLFSFLFPPAHSNLLMIHTEAGHRKGPGGTR